MYIELWKWIPGYEGLYMVSTHGRVKRNGKIRKQSTYKSGYMYVGLHKNGKGKNWKIHRLVALAFIPNPDNLPEVNHKDENKTNNHVSNLEWCDRTYNNNYGTRIEKFRKSIQGKYTGNNSPHYGEGKPILMFSKDGEFIKKFGCIADANEYLGKDRNNPNIGKCARREQNTAWKYKWIYEQDLAQEEQQEQQDTNK